MQKGEHTRLGIASLVFGGVAVIAEITVFVLLAIYRQEWAVSEEYFIDLITRHGRELYSPFFAGIISGLAAIITGGISHKDSFGRFGAFMGILGLCVAGVFFLLLFFASVASVD